MIISVWRYSHLLLAVSSFLLLTLASLTGIVLAFDPVTEKVQPYRAVDPASVTLAETLPLLKKNFGDVQELRVDHNGFVILYWTNEEGDSKKTYVDPRKGAVLGPVKEQSPFFQWVTGLHRSLFLHDTGRVLVGVTSFLLALIVVSGIILIVQRQKGFRRFFARVGRDSGAQYYHVVSGRIALAPILLIALTGAYLSVTRFGWVKVEEPSVEVDFDKIEAGPPKEWSSFPVFRNTKLSDLQSLEFPFSDDVEDYFTVKRNDRIVAVNQVTGDLLSEAAYSNAARLSAWSLEWHTGRSGIVWAMILAVACGYILFFIGSGFVITFRRRANRFKNKFRPEESTTVILVGSENGSTLRFARSVCKQLMARGEKAYLTDLDNYRIFPAMRRLVAMTSTHGLGDPPSNAGKFLKRLEKLPQQNLFSFSVVAFGSRGYDDFCRFGMDVDAALRRQTLAVPDTNVFTVDDRSPQDFSAWSAAWSHATGFSIELSAELLPAERKDLLGFKVKEKTKASEIDETFLVRLQCPKRLHVRSGDLLAVYPASDHRERLYSIGMDKNEAVLVVKRHPMGLGSGFLDALAAGDTLRARIVQNSHFHFPVKAPAVIMISNGTGIAPFLGMLGENTKKAPVHLYCGFRWKRSLEHYEHILAAARAEGRLEGLHASFSREVERMYVTDLLARDTEAVLALLEAGAVVMVCGSLAMQKDVLELLGSMVRERPGLADQLQEKGRILTDCY